MDQVRIEGSVLLVFDCPGLMKLDHLVGNAPSFQLCVDAGFVVWRFCSTSARIWPTHVTFAVPCLGIAHDARGGQALSGV